MTEESGETAPLNVSKRRSPAGNVVELDEVRWRAWQAKCREHDRATALRVRLWLGIVLTVSSVSGLIWGIATR